VLSFDGVGWTVAIGGEPEVIYDNEPDAARYERERLAGRGRDQAVALVAEAWWREGSA
jgi:hypothetical protein